MTGRILGLDYGAKTVGVAVSDALGVTAQPVETITRDREAKLRQTLSRIEELVREYKAPLIVLGFPKMMNNTLGERADKTLEFKALLEKRTGLPVVLQDERLSTAEAERLMIEGGVTGRSKRKSSIDAVAASIILQIYMERMHSDV